MHTKILLLLFKSPEFFSRSFFFSFPILSCVTLNPNTKNESLNKKEKKCVRSFVLYKGPFKKKRPKRRMGNNGSTPATQGHGGVNHRSDGGVAGNTQETNGGGTGTGDYYNNTYNNTNDDASSLGGHSLEGGGSSHHSTYEHGPVTQTVPIPGAQSSHLNNLTTTHGGGAGGGHAGTTRGGGGGGEALEPALVPVAITCASRASSVFAFFFSLFFSP